MVLLDVLERDDRLAPSLPARTLVELLRERAQRDSERELIHFLDDGETVSATLTPAGLERRARAIAAELQARGLAGQRALLLFPPGPGYVEAFYGCLFAGVLAVPAYPPNPSRLRPTLRRLVSIVRDAEPAILLTTADARPLVERLAALDPVFAELPVCATDAIPSAQGDEWRPQTFRPDATAFVQYTSGSTADPKGVLVTHANVLHTTEGLARCVAYREWERLLIWLPTFHDMGLICGLIIPLYKGLPMYLMSPLAFLQRPLRWWQAVSDYGITQTVGPNFSYDLSVRKSTAEQRAALRLDALRITGSVAEPIRSETIEALFKSGYGLAESTLMVTGGRLHWISVDSDALRVNRVVPAPEDSPSARSIVCCGTTGYGMSVRIVNPDTLCLCAPDEVGEIWVSGPSIAQGYWNRLEESKPFFEAQIADTGEGPFLRTGDLGFLRKNELYVTGRLKDLIILDGVNVYPQDIEWTIQVAHAAIRPGSCAVFGIERNGRERVVAVMEVAASAGTDGQAQSVIKAVRRAVAESHQIALEDQVLLKPGSVSKTSSGKIQRHAARKKYLEGKLETWEL